MDVTAGPGRKRNGCFGGSDGRELPLGQLRATNHSAPFRPFGSGRNAHQRALLSCRKAEARKRFAWADWRPHRSPISNRLRTFAAASRPAIKDIVRNAKSRKIARNRPRIKQPPSPSTTREESGMGAWPQGIRRARAAASMISRSLAAPARSGAPLTSDASNPASSSTPLFLRAHGLRPSSGRHDRERVLGGVDVGRGARRRCGRRGPCSGTRWRRRPHSLPEARAALGAGSRLQPPTWSVVCTVVTHLRFMAGVALARPGLRGPAVRATQDNTTHPFGSSTASLAKSARRSDSG